MSIRLVTLLLCLLPGLLLAAPLKVVVSILPMQTFVEQVAGDTVSVQSLVKPGFDPHHYEPSPQQIGRLAAAEVYFTLGMPSEAVWVRRMQAINPNLRIINVAGKRHAEEEHHHAAHSHRMHDEHIWTSPAQTKQIIAAIAHALTKLAPRSADRYARNAASYTDLLTQLESEITQQLQQQKLRTFMVLHPAWQAFAEQFGLEQVAIEVEGKEPGPRSLAYLIKRARQEQIRLVLVQPQFSPGAAQQIAREINGRVEVVDPLAPDYTDNLRLLTHLLMEAATND